MKAGHQSAGRMIEALQRRSQGTGGQARLTSECADTGYDLDTMSRTSGPKPEFGEPSLLRRPTTG